MLYILGANTSYAYNAIGQRTSATDANGSYTYVYDNRDRLTSEIKHDGSELVYGYDAAGNRTTLTTVVAGVTNTATYTFDALNRMASVTDNDGNATSYTFDANSNQTRIDQANSTATTMVFDDLNRVSIITHLGTAGETLTSLTYSLDDTGRRTAINESTGRSSNYTYDELYRLTGETITDNEVGNYSASYEYNAVSNRIADTVNGTSSNYTYDDNDRITAHGLDSYSYDDNGNTITEVVNGQSNSYAYDSQNRLIEANMGGVAQAMAYDPDGVRIQKSSNGDTTDYLTDSNRDYAQVLYERSATSELNYTFGTDLVGLSTRVENFTYHSDALGSTRLLTNDSGDVADDVRYDAWGEVLSGGDVLENQYLYTGEQFDGGLGKTYLRARYYDAGVGRFSQMDEWNGRANAPRTLNKYLYADADSVNFSDPSGHFSLGSLMKALNVASSMYTVTEASIGVFGSISAGESANIGDIGMALITSKMAAGGKMVKLIARKVCGKNDCKFPILNYRHIFYGEVKSRTGKGFHSTAIVNNIPLAGSAYVESEIWRNVNGVYKAWVKIPDPKGNRYRKAKQSTMFPDSWRPSLVGGSLYLSWMKNRGRTKGTLNLGAMKIQYFVRNGMLEGYPLR